MSTSYEVPVPIVRYECPLPSCTWACDPPQPGVAVPPRRQDAYLSALAEGPSGDPMAEASFEQLLRHSLAAEEVIEEHLDTHSLLEWVTEIQRLKEIIDTAAIALSDQGWIGAFVSAGAEPGNQVSVCRADLLRRFAAAPERLGKYPARTDSAG